MMKIDIPMKQITIHPITFYGDTLDDILDSLVDQVDYYPFPIPTYIQDAGRDVLKQFIHDSLIMNHLIEGEKTNVEKSVMKKLLHECIEQETYVNDHVIFCHWDNQYVLTELGELFDQADGDRTLEQEVEAYIYENDFLPEHAQPYRYVQALLSKYPDMDEEALFDLFYTEYTIDLRIPDLLNQTFHAHRGLDGDVGEVTLYFGTNWDDDYMHETIWQDLDELTDEDERLTHSQVYQLLRSQGYTLDDLKKSDSPHPFIRSLREELFDYKTDLSGLQLIAVPHSSNLDALFQLHTKASGVIKAGTKFGLFNRIHGSGTGLEVEIPNDIVMTPNHPLHLYEVDIQTHHTAYHYSPYAVYGGFIRPDNEQIESTL